MSWAQLNLLFRKLTPNVLRQNMFILSYGDGEELFWLSALSSYFRVLCFPLEAKGNRTFIGRLTYLLSTSYWIVASKGLGESRLGENTEFKLMSKLCGWLSAPWRIPVWRLGNAWDL